MRKRSGAFAGFLFVLSTLGACQLVTGLDDLSTPPEGSATGVDGGATSSSAAGPGSSGSGGDSGSGSVGSGGAGGDAGAGGGGGAASGTGGGGGAGGGDIVDCAAKCPEKIISATTKAPYVLAINATHIFWHNSGANDPYEGTIWRLPLDGSGGEALVVAKSTPSSLVADNQGVFYTDNTSSGAVMTAPAFAMSDMGTELENDFGYQATGIAADAQNLYWIRNGVAGIKMRPKSAGPGGPMVATDMPNKITDLVYSNPYIVYKGSQGISRVQVEPVGMPVLVTAAAADPAVYDIDADENGSYVYWTKFAAQGSVHRALLRGLNEPGELLVSGEDRPYYVTATSTHVYWSANGSDCSQGTGSIRRRALGAGPQDIEILAQGICGTNFVQSGTHVFFASGNTIYRIPK